MKNFNVKDYVWQYDNCRNYSHVENNEAWDADCRAIGTSGNLELETVGTLCRDDETGEMSLWIGNTEVSFQ